MYKLLIRPTKTDITTKPLKNGEPMEAKVRRILNNDEPITDGIQEAYTEREEGVRPEFDARTDKWDIAIEATEKAQNNTLRQRELRIGEKTFDTMTPEQQQEFNTKFPGNKHAGKTSKGEGKA